MAYTSPSITPSGTTFAQFQGGGPGGQLARLIASNLAASSAPTAPTVSANGGGTVGGLLAVGSVYVKVTESDGVGETTASTEVGPTAVTAQAAPTGTPTVSVTGSGGTLPAGVYYGKFTYVDSHLNAAGVHGETTAGTEFTFTQTGTAEPVITINDGGLPSWASGRNLYLTAAGGGAGNEVLAFTGITGTTYTITAAPGASTTAPPSVNTTSTTIPQITFAALQTGNVSRSVYVGTASGAEVLYAAGVTAGTYSLSAAIPTNSYAVAAPTVNTTGLTYVDANGVTHNKALQYLDAAIRNPSAGMVRPWLDMVQLVGQFNRGEPVRFDSLVTQFRHCHTFFAAIAQACGEMGTLMDANPGHLVPSQNAATVGRTVRQWP